MSRTYRCRHLPMSGGWSRYSARARKVADGVGRWSWRDVHDVARAEVEALYGPRPEPSMRFVRSKGLTHVKYHPAVYLTDAQGKYVKNALGRLWMVKQPWREVLPGRLMQTRESWEWDQEVERREREFVLPISSGHLLQRHPSVGNRKRFERVQANRAARRRMHIILRSETIDEDWDGYFPGKRDYFDWWSVY